MVWLRTTLSQVRQMPQRGQSRHSTGAEGSGGGAVSAGGEASESAIVLGTPLLEIQRMVRRTTQGSIWLQSKRGTGKAMRKRDPCTFGRTINIRRYERFRQFRRVDRGSFGIACGGELGAAKRGTRELLPQFQPDIPNPLCQDLSKFLAPRGMRVPSI